MSSILSRWSSASVLAIVVLSGGGQAPVAAQQPKPPVSILPPSIPPLPPVPGQPSQPSPTVPAVPNVAPMPIFVPHWTAGDASALLNVINSIGTSGLIPKDYAPAALAAAILGGEGDALDKVAGDAFTKLATDMRDGRTPATARIQWLVKDTDAATFPTLTVMQKALADHNVAGAITSLEPVHPDYIALKAELAATPVINQARHKVIQANMDRWRWLPQTLGTRHVIANVPEYVVRLMVNGKLISNHRVIVGKVDTPTPQLSANAVGVVIHPPWYLPQSIIKESVGALIARSPAAAKARGYTWTGSGKTLAVTQQAGPSSALGYIKIDMPNAEAIFLHDTPNRNLFNANARAFSHGCLRTEDVMKLAIILGVIQQGGTADELVTLIKAGKTVKVPFKETIPVIIGYFTVGKGLDGKLQTFKDIYGRDNAVIASFDQPRVEPKPIIVTPTLEVPAPITPALPTIL